MHRWLQCVLYKVLVVQPLTPQTLVAPLLYSVSARAVLWEGENVVVYLHNDKGCPIKEVTHPQVGQEGFRVGVAL